MGVSRGIGAICAAVVLGVGLAGAPSALASSTGNPGTDVGFTPGITSDQAGQTFTVPAGADNFLFRLRILGFTNVDPQTFTIQSASAGSPTNTVLWTGPSVPAAGTYRAIDLYPNLTVTPGQQYTVAVGTVNGISIRGTNTDAYAGGALFFRIATGFPGAGTWSESAGDDIGFLAEFNTGQVATTTDLSCVPQSLLLDNPSTCTATLTVSGTGAPVSGATIGFSTTGAGSIPASCVTGAGGSCAVNYTEGQASTPTVTASFAGDGTNAPSQGTVPMTFTRRDATPTASCPAQVALNAPASCTLTVTDTSPGNTSTPTGGSVFAADVAGTFSPNPCTLSGGTCSFTYTPSALGTANVGAAYGGDSKHVGAAFTFLDTVEVTKRATGTALSCTPSAGAIGQASACTVSVSDTAAGTTSTPTGSVAVTNTGSGSPSAPSCTLAAGSCSFSYTPSGGGSSTITAAYGGDAEHAASSGAADVTAPQTKNCTSIQRKLNRLKKKLKRQLAGAGDSKKSARKRAKIRRNIADTKKRKRKRRC